ncbi:MAG: response regulator [Bdellovibrionota bacterium]
MLQRKPNRILIVEDSKEDFMVIHRAFNRVGMVDALFHINNGDEALDYLHKEGKYRDSSTHVLPEMVILDLNLPGVDGREILKKMKGNTRLKKIPVIILTTSADESDVEACYTDGANSYIQKPVEFKGFIDAVEHIKEYWFGISLLPNGLH